MSDKAKTKWFCVAVAGATCDGRVIDPAWIQQMAASYAPKVYTAVVNCEHIKGAHPESSFGSYGTVLALKTENVTINGQEKPALYAQIKPNENLVKLTKSGQKLFTSVEISPKFSDTDQAYLIGLAVTDNPASLGTEMLEFSAKATINPLAHKKQHPDNLFSVAEEVKIEIEEDKPSVLDTVKSLFTKQNKKQDTNFAQQEQAIVEVATEAQKIGQDVEALEAKFNTLQSDYNGLKTKLEQTPNTPSRPKSDNTNFTKDDDLGVDC